MLGDRPCAPGQPTEWRLDRVEWGPDVAVLVAVADHGPVTVMELCERADVSPVVADQRCFELHRDGLLTLCETGAYELTEKGKRLLARRSVT